MIKRAVSVGATSGLLVALLGLCAWTTGRPFLFPSLGPTAFALALDPEGNTVRPVVGGHLCGVLAGLLAYHATASGLMVTTAHAPLSASGLRLAASGALSVALTAGSMLLTRARHAPACATTLIVSLGLLSEIADGAVIMVAVALLYGAHRLIRALGRGGQCGAPSGGSPSAP